MRLRTRGDAAPDDQEQEGTMFARTSTCQNSRESEWRRDPIGDQRHLPTVRACIFELERGPRVRGSPTYHTLSSRSAKQHASSAFRCSSAKLVTSLSCWLGATTVLACNIAGCGWPARMHADFVRATPRRSGQGLSERIGEVGDQYGGISLVDLRC